MFTRNGAIPPVPSAPPRAASPAGHNDVEAFSIDLSVPLAGHHGPISHLSFRQPTLGDYVDIGPVSRTIATNPGDLESMRIEVIEEPQAVLRWICRLCGHPEAIIRTMSPRDFAAVRSEISIILAEYSAGNASRTAPASSSVNAG